MSQEIKKRRRSRWACQLVAEFRSLGTDEVEVLYCDKITTAAVDEYTAIELRARDGGIYNVRNASFLVSVRVNENWRQS